jgi:DHA2 family metal-tetracycline-proton antiporter-like MFS transporter
MGGIGMMSAGLIGTPGLGYAKDRFTAEALKEKSVALYDQYRASTPSRFLFFREVPGIDGKKLGEVQAEFSRVRVTLAQTPGHVGTQATLATLSLEVRAVHEASVQGDRKTLKVDAFIPASMAVIFLGLTVYFKLIGGYRRVSFIPEKAGVHDNEETVVA